jgi:hypothetical protein
VWNELFQNYLGSLLNRYRVLLLYVLRKEEAALLDPIEIAALPTAHERFLQTTPLDGNQYETNNGRVFELLESLLIKGNYHSYIESYKVARDGRGGYLTLSIMHFEGPTVVGTSLEDSYSQLEKLQFSGNKANFSFDNFVDKHVKAYSNIKRLGDDDKVISDKKKVRNFLSRIRTNDAALLSAKVQVIANPAMSSNFTSCCDFMRQIAPPFQNPPTLKTSVQLALPVLNQKLPGSRPLPFRTNSGSITDPARRNMSGYCGDMIPMTLTQVEEPTGKYCMVRSFDKSYKPVPMEIVSAVTAYNHPNGKTHILEVNKALYSPQQEPSLLNPNQMRWNHLIVDDVPRQFDSRSTHSFRFPETDCTIPLRLQGIMSTFPICAPTQEEKEECTHLPLTSRECWEPNSDLLEIEEEQTTVRLQVDVSSSLTKSTRGLYAIESQSTCLRDIHP